MADAARCESAQLTLEVMAQAKAGSVFRGAPPTQSYLRVSVGVAQGRSPGAALVFPQGLRATLCAALAPPAKWWRASLSASGRVLGSDRAASKRCNFQKRVYLLM